MAYFSHIIRRDCGECDGAEATWWAVWVGGFAIWAALSHSAAAQSQSQASPQSAPSSWQQRYAQARVALLDERLIEAEHEFRLLEQTAQSADDRRLAREFARLAGEALERRDPGSQHRQLRTSDELTMLYTTALFYAFGTSGWLDLQLKPRSFGAAILPFALLTPAMVAAVALIDGYRPLPHGIPQAIAAGMYLGFGEGLWLVGYQNAYADQHPRTKRWSSDRVPTALWASSTVGGVTGALLGVLRRPTPGRVSFTSSLAIWGGLLTAFATQAIGPDANDRKQRAYLFGAAGYNIGMASGLLLSSTVVPSVTRVRFADLGGLFGALAGGCAYALVSPQRTARGALGVAGAGGLLGLGFTWWATSSMPPDRSHERPVPATGSLTAGLRALQPMIMPTRSGVLAGFSGQL